MTADPKFQARTTDDAVRPIQALMAAGGVKFGEGVPPNPAYPRAVIRFRGNSGSASTRTVWCEPPASFLEDHVTAAARLVFGVEAGTIRAVQGEPGVLEMREAWPNPLTLSVRESVKVRVLDHLAAQKAEETLKVETACFPGCDVRAVVLASAAACCERKYGPGSIAWCPGSDTRIEFIQGHLSQVVSSTFRFTVHRKGGSASELLVQLPGRQACDWNAILYAAGKRCNALFGRGVLKYLPEVAGNEVHFSFG